MLYIIKDILGIHSDKEIARKEFDESFKSLKSLNPNFAEMLNEMNRTNIHYITKAMWRKYNDRKKGDLTKYNKFVDLARAYWKMQYK